MAGVESMRRHRDILFGCQFTWVTDHKGLAHPLKQKNLSARQARWIEKISEFNFDVEYLPGPLNVLPDALSRTYSNGAPGAARSPSEFTEHDDEEDLPLRLASFATSLITPVDWPTTDCPVPRLTLWHLHSAAALGTTVCLADATVTMRTQVMRPCSEVETSLCVRRVHNEWRTGLGTQFQSHARKKRRPLTDITHLVNGLQRDQQHSH